MSQNGRPKLEIAVGESTHVKLLKDPYAGKNAFGNYVLITLLHEGSEKVLFGGTDIQESLNEAGVIVGSEFMLSRMTNGKKGASKWVIEKVSAPVETVPKGDSFKATMHQCLTDALELTRSFKDVPFQNEDIRAISSGLFIARTR